MIINEIENLRERLNELVEECDCGSLEVLELSREMDMLILTYLKQTQKNSSATANS